MKKLILVSIAILLQVSLLSASQLWKTSFDEYKQASKVEGIRFVNGKWDIKNVPTPNGKGNNVMRQFGRAQDGLQNQKNDFSIALLEKYSKFTDGIFYARLRINSAASNENAGLIVRYKNPQNFVYVGFSANKKVSVYKVVNGRVLELAKSEIGVDPKQWVGLRVFMRDYRIKVEVNGNVALQFSNVSLKQMSGLGFCSFKSATADFDNVIVAPLEKK